MVQNYQENCILEFSSATDSRSDFFTFFLQRMSAGWGRPIWRWRFEPQIYRIEAARVSSSATCPFSGCSPDSTGGRGRRALRWDSVSSRCPRPPLSWRSNHGSRRSLAGGESRAPQRSGALRRAALGERHETNNRTRPQTLQSA